MHIIFSTPTHYTADAIYETIDKLNKDIGSDLQPLRVYRPMSEVQAWESQGIKKSTEKDTNAALDAQQNDEEVHETVGPESIIEKDQLAELESELKPRNSDYCNQIVDSIFKDLVPKTKGETANAEGNNRAVAAENPAGEKCMSIEYTTEMQLWILGLAETILKAEKDRCYSLLDKSLVAHAVQYALAAEKTDEKLLERYPFNKNIAILWGISTEDDFGGVTPLDDEVDMFKKVRNYLIKMRQEQINSWKSDDHWKATIAFRDVCQHVTEKATLLVSINSNLGSSIPAHYFGKDAKSIILIRDEDPKELEVNGWIPLTKMEHANKIQDIVICGDLAQLQGIVLSATDVPGWNEFCLKLE